MRPSSPASLLLLRIAFAVAAPLFVRVAPRPEDRIEVVLGERVLPVRVLVLGAGVGVGFGVAGARQALPGRLASHLSSRSGRGVEVVTRVRAEAAVAGFGALAEEGLLAKQDLVVLCPALPDLLRAGSPDWRADLVRTVQDVRGRMPLDSRLVLLGLPVPQHDGALERIARTAVAGTNRVLAEVAGGSPNTVHVAAPPFDTLRPGGRSFDAAFYERCAARIADAVASGVALRSFAP